MIIQDNKLFSKIVASQGKLLAIDIGTKRLGIAVCDATRTIVTPKKIIDRKGNQQDFAAILEIIESENIVAIVIGMPINMDGESHKMTIFAKKFAENFDDFLQNKFAIFFTDERLTSFEARTMAQEISRRRKHQKHNDDIAASLILQGFIDDGKA